MGIKINNINRLLARFNNIENIDLEPIITQATLLVEAQAKALVPNDTGNLMGTIHPQVLKKLANKTIEGRVYTSCEYAMYVEFGTGINGNGTYPYDIEKLKLEYRNTPWRYTPDGGDTFYFTFGQVAKPYMYPALERNKKKINKMVKNEITNLLEKQCKGGL